MELHNRIYKKLAIRGIKKININNYILNHIEVQSKSNISMNQTQILDRLEKFSRRPLSNELSICKRTDWNQQKKYKLAIIVPVYNGERYIVKCIESLLHQVTQYKYQIILINDGSTDGTSTLIKNYVSDSKILYVEQKNKGHSGARNKGLEMVNAEYITFVDSDDYVSKMLVQTLLEAAESYNADIVQGGFEKFMYNGLISKRVAFNEEIIKNTYTVSGFPWAKIFRASLFEKVQFPEGYWYEDSIMSHLIYPLAKKVVTVSEILYFYRVNLHGISRTSVKFKKCIDSSWILEQMLISRKELAIANTPQYLNLFLGQIIINFKREFNVDEDIKVAIFMYSSNLYHTYFSGNESCLELSFSKRKLLLALKNKDYQAYKKICSFIN